MRRIAYILLWLYVFTLPWDHILQFGEPIGSVSRVAAIVAFAGCVALVTTSGRMRRMGSFHVATLVYLGIVASSLFWTADPANTPQFIRAYMQSAFVVWLLWELASSRRALLWLSIAYVAGSYVSALSILSGFLSATIAAGAREARFSGDNWDSNDLALVLALAIPLAFYIASKRTHWTSSWLARGYLILGPLAILLTSSRSGIVVMSIALCAMPMILRRQTATAKLVIMLVFACAGYLAWNYAPHQSWDRLSTIYSSVRAGDLNSRELTWRAGLSAFGSNWLVGVGAGAFQAGAGTYYTAHNTFLAVLVEQGLVGFSVFSVILGGAIYSTRRLDGEERWTCVFLLLCWAVGAFTLGWAMNRVTWFVLALIVSFGHIDWHDTLLLNPEVEWKTARSAGCV